MLPREKTPALKKKQVWGLQSAQPHFTLEGHEKGVNCLDYFTGGEKPYSQQQWSCVPPKKISERSHTHNKNGGSCAKRMASKINDVQF